MTVSEKTQGMATRVASQEEFWIERKHGKKKQVILLTLYVRSKR